MAEVAKEENFELKKALKIALKTFVECFVLIMFILCSIFVLFPKFSLKINSALGLKKVKELNYQMIYSRSGNIADLYNVILFEGEIKNHEKELEFIDEIIKREDYSEFCESLDKASLKSASDKSMIPYLVNVNGFLLSRKVDCLYNTNVNGIEAYVFRQTSTGKLSEYSFSTYVDLVQSDKNLTKQQKYEKISDLMLLSSDINGGLVSLEDLVENRVNLINDRLEIETEDFKKIALTYTLSRIYRSRYYAYEILGDETKKLENKSLFEEVKTKLNGLIGV